MIKTHFTCLTCLSIYRLSVAVSLEPESQRYVLFTSVWKLKLPAIIFQSMFVQLQHPDLYPATREKRSGQKVSTKHIIHFGELSDEPWRARKENEIKKRWKERTWKNWVSDYLFRFSAISPQSLLLWVLLYRRFPQNTNHVVLVQRERVEKSLNYISLSPPFLLFGSISIARAFLVSFSSRRRRGDGEEESSIC